MSKLNELKFKKFPVLDEGFICLVDVMGDDSSIVQAAKVSFGNDELIPKRIDCPDCGRDWGHGYCGTCYGNETLPNPEYGKFPKDDRKLIRYLMDHQHSTPFEMVEIKFMIQAPMDCWRQWIRHRTANVNEYSTRYMPAIDDCQTTQPDQWRLQSTDNKQGSLGFLNEWPNGYHTERNSDGDSCNVIHHITKDGNVKWVHVQAGPHDMKPGEYLSALEEELHNHARSVYNRRLSMGVAKEQARKDLPLSTYTRAYWKCDLHNIFNFLRLRMDSHAQLEIRSYANAMYTIVKQIVPVACEAFEDYVLNAHKFSAMEMNVLRSMLKDVPFEVWNQTNLSGMTNREVEAFKKKVWT